MLSSVLFSIILDVVYVYTYSVVYEGAGSSSIMAGDLVVKKGNGETSLQKIESRLLILPVDWRLFVVFSRHACALAIELC